MQACERCSVNLVRLDLGPSDGPDLQWVGDHDAMREWLKQPNNGCRIASGLKHDVVFFGQGLGKLEHGESIHREAAMLIDLAVLDDRHLRKVPMHIQADNSHMRPPVSETTRRKLADNTTTTDSRSQRNRASRRGSQITTRARSSLSNLGLPANTYASVAPIPVCARYACWSVVRREARGDKHAR
ncbi:hypothetical protein GmRootV35_13320 [Variovorax sp. V35]